MSGFIGFTGAIESADDIVGRMLERIVHRGPDHIGKYLDKNITLGFRRLPLIVQEDYSKPFYNEEKTIVGVFNCTIYNYETLMNELQGLGHHFETNTDAETLIHLYEEYGTDMFSHLRGPFAFAIYDTIKNKLICARDFFGVKPLYYTHIDGNIMFGSEIKSFLEHPGFRKEVNEQALENYLTFQYSVLPETFFKGVYKLPPAHYMVYEENELMVKQFWQPKFDPEVMDLPQAMDKLETVLQESIELHEKVTDVEIGSLLSSGVDSSFIAASFSGNKTFTVGFDNEKYNEIGYAKTLTSKLGIENYSKVISKDEYWDKLPEIQYYMDEPLADASAVALYFAGQTASSHVKITFSGEGVDEFFGGYTIYKQPLDIKPIASLPRFIRKLLGALASIIPFGIKGKNYLINASKDVEERFIGNAYIFTKKEREKILRRFTGHYSPHEITAPYYKECIDRNGQPQDDVTKMQTLDIRLWAVGDILLKADKMSMANSLEIRTPVLDKEVFLAASKLPTELRCTKQQTKYAFRQVAQKKLPPEVAEKEKLGFPVPIRVWLREEKYYLRVKEYFTSPAAEKYFIVKNILKILDAHKQGRQDHSRKIWTILMFLIWYEQYFAEGL